MGCHEKFCYIRTCDVQKHYYGVVLLKLLYKTEATGIVIIVRWPLENNGNV